MEEREVEEEAEEKTPPVAVLLIGLLVVVFSFFMICVNGYLVWLFSGDLFVSYTSIAIIVIVLFAAGVVEFISGIGFLKLKKWAWTWTFYSMGVAFLMFIALIVNLATIGAIIGGFPTAGAAAAVATIVLIGPILIHIFVMAFLLTKEIKTFFLENH